MTLPVLHGVNITSGMCFIQTRWPMNLKGVVFCKLRPSGTSSIAIFKSSNTVIGPVTGINNIEASTD